MEVKNVMRAKEDLLYDINKMKISEHTMYRLLRALDLKEHSKIKNLLFYILFNYINKVLTNILNQYEKPKLYLTMDKNGDITIYDQKFLKKKSPSQIF